MARNSVRNRRGVALISIILVGVVLSIITLALILRSTSDRGVVLRNRTSAQSTAAVESAISRARTRISQAFKSAAAQTTFRVTQASLAVPPSLAGAANSDETYVNAGGTSYYQFPFDDDSDDPDGDGLTSTGAAATPPRQVRYTIRLEPTCWVDTGCTGAALSSYGRPIDCTSLGNIKNADINSGWCTGTASQGIFQNYIVTAALVEANERPWYGIQAKITVTRSSAFRGNFATYKDNLEIFPGGGFTIRGGIHSNANTYIGNGVNLRHLYEIGDPLFDDHDSDLNSVGQIYRHRLHNGNAESDVNVFVKTFNTTTGAFDYAQRVLTKDNDSVAVGSSLSPYNVGYINDVDLNGNGILTDIGDVDVNSDGVVQTGEYYKGTGTTPGANEWTQKSNWANNSSDFFGDRLHTNSAAFDIPNADTLDPNSPANVTLAAANENGLRVETVTAQTSPPPITAGVTANLAPGETVVWRNGDAVAVVSADGLTEWPAINTDAGSKDSNKIVKGTTPRGSGTTGENCNTNPPPGTFIPANTALLPAATERKFPKCTFYSSSFRDGREAGNGGPALVTVTNINIKNLGTSGLAPESGLIYATRFDTAAGTVNANGTFSGKVPNGIRLQQGSEVPQRAVTSDTNAPTCASNASLNCREITNFNLTTNNPVYVQGDLNLHTSSSEGSDTWKPATVISDATTVLSNAWRDTNNQTSNNHDASFTQVNAVIASGIVASKGNQYSGGLENFPRLLENWNNNSCRTNAPASNPKTCVLKLQGSLIQLWRSRFGTGAWQSTNAYYQPPQLRDWGYDKDLLAQPDDIFGAGLGAATKTIVGGKPQSDGRSRVLQKSITRAEINTLDALDRIPVTP
ncbi:hypothetical protein [Anthocerotibacter panamensis]|uniref:hypothetical protein n=1 Tax=Anthocerotibacter panamensis TaxID=2857077 RepID=UPI001C401A5B|nr:hypothetical protein [Anthocerotibacter panamensis]